MRFAMKSTMLVAAGLFATMSANVMAQDKMSGDKMAGGKMMVSSQDKMFMVAAEHSNLAEIKTSQLALTKTSKPELKEYAQKMIEAHTKAEDDLKQLATSKGVTLPGDPGADNKAKYAKMSTLNGAAFNSNYMAVQKTGHDMTITAFNKEISGGKDADVKAYAQKYLPDIMDHDKMITALKMGKMKSMDKMGGKM